MGSKIVTLAAAVLASAAALSADPGSAAESVMVQCGQQYQAAKTAGTLNGMDWNQFRTSCATRLKAEPAAAAAPPAAGPAAAAAPVAPPAATVVGTAPAPTASPTATAPAAPGGGGMAAMHRRQKLCGAEWTSGKATLVKTTPGLTWPRYWSQCNTRLKAAGQ